MGLVSLWGLKMLKLKTTEYQEQKAFVDYLKIKNIAHFSVPNEQKLSGIARTNKSLAGIIFGVINGFANFPQIYKIFKTKSVKDLSIITYLILTVGTIVWVLYGIEIMNVPVLTMNGLALIEFIFILIGCYLYRKN